MTGQRGDCEPNTWSRGYCIHTTDDRRGGEISLLFGELSDYVVPEVHFLLAGVEAHWLPLQNACR